MAADNRSPSPALVANMVVHWRQNVEPTPIEPVALDSGVRLIFGL